MSTMQDIILKHLRDHEEAQRECQPSTKKEWKEETCLRLLHVHVCHNVYLSIIGYYIMLIDEGMI